MRMQGILKMTDQIIRDWREKAGKTYFKEELDEREPLVREILELKKQKNALILGHNYMTPDVFHGISDFVGDSLELAKRSRDSQADIILFNGVHFMAETAKILNPTRKVLIADLKAGCSLAESMTGEDVRQLRAKYPGVDAAYTNSGGLRQDLLVNPPTAGEQPGEITWGEMFSVLPFGNRTVILTLTGAQLEQAFINGFTPFCFPGFSGGTGRFPQISGMKVTFTCNGNTPVVTGMWKTPQGINGPATPIGPADTIRFVTNDFMLTGGDGYTVFAQGTNVQQPGDDLLQVAIEYVTANSPVAPVVEGRIVGP